MKRYKLKRDLPTFKAGDIFVLIDSGSLIHESDGVVAYSWSTIDKFPNILTDWFEEIKPAEPLIKDEKIRNAVRAWAEACFIETVEYDEYWVSFRRDDKTISFKDEDRCLGFYGLENSRDYTIAELCGEDK